LSFDVLLLQDWCVKKAATPLLQEPQLARLVPGTSYLSSKYTLKTNQEIERPLHQSGGWLLEHSNQSREFTLHMAKAQFLWLKQCEVKKNLARLRASVSLESLQNAV
jgi:hypothetical protein